MKILQMSMLPTSTPFQEVAMKGFSFDVTRDLKGIGIYGDYRKFSNKGAPSNKCAPGAALRCKNGSHASLPEMILPPYNEVDCQKRPPFYKSMDHASNQKYPLSPWNCRLAWLPFSHPRAVPGKGAPPIKHPLVLLAIMVLPP